MSMVGSFGSGTFDLMRTVVSSFAVASRSTVVALWLIHSSSRLVLTFQATSSAVSGLPSDHLSPSRSLYVHVSPSLEPFHDSARPGLVWKSLAALSVSVAYWMFHASYAATVTPISGFMLSMPCGSPTVKTTFFPPLPPLLSSWLWADTAIRTARRSAQGTMTRASRFMTADSLTRSHEIPVKKPLQPP